MKNMVLYLLLCLFACVSCTSESLHVETNHEKYEHVLLTSGSNRYFLFSGDSDLLPEDHAFDIQGEYFNIAVAAFQNQIEKRQSIFVYRFTRLFSSFFSSREKNQSLFLFNLHSPGRKILLQKRILRI